MRDLETIQAALTIAETGHLAFATLHTNSAAEAINRIIDVFPAHQQSQVRAQLAFVLEGIVTQTLLPKAEGKGRVDGRRDPGRDTPAIRALIRDDKVHQIYSSMQAGQEVRHADAERRAVPAVHVRARSSKEECLRVSGDPNEFLRMIGKTPVDEQAIERPTAGAAQVAARR